MNFLFIEPIMYTNVGLAYLSAVLLKHGHRVHVICRPDVTVDQINRKIEQFDPHVIGFSILSNVPRQIENLTRDIKKRKETLLICGGPEITLNPCNFLEKNSRFDFAVVGEAEETVLDIVNFVNKEKGLKDIKGIVGRDGKDFFDTGRREFQKNLDVIPFPVYDVFDIYEKGMSEYGILTSRGCPYQCTYCNGPRVSGRTWRFRSVGNVVEELVQVKNSHPDLEVINIYDDNFTLNINRAKEICRGIIDKGLKFKLKLPNGIRADKVDDELAALMKRAGFYFARVGIESGSPEVFNQLKKGETLEDIEKGVGILKKHGIKVHGSFIIGLPYSTYQKDMQSIKFARQLRLDSADFFIFCPLKGTKASELTYQQQGVRILRAENEMPVQYWSGKPYSVFDTEDYPEKDRIKAFMKGNLKFNDYKITQTPGSRQKYTLARLINLLRVIIVYDTFRIPIHFFRIPLKVLLSTFIKLFPKVKIKV